MSVLVNEDIMKEMGYGNIIIEPFDDKALGTNSYDVHLARTLLVYQRRVSAWHQSMPLDCKIDNPTTDIVIDGGGFVLLPGELYLAVTAEYTETLRHIPFLEGKSSLGRLGLSIHVTAGKGDVGFCGHWTMEMTVVRPLRIYAGMPIGQLIYHTVTSQPSIDYAAKVSQKYAARGSRSDNPVPVASRMYRNFEIKE